MRTTRDLRRLRQVIFEALVDYLENISREIAKEHYVNYRWFLLLFPVYLVFVLSTSLIMYIYLLIHGINEDDFADVNLVVSTQTYYLAFVLLSGRQILRKMYKERPLSEAPFYLRACFLNSATEFAYLNCLNRLVKDPNDDLSVSKEEQKLLRKVTKTPFWPIENRMPWELKMPKLPSGQRLKEVFWRFIGFYDKLPLIWREEEILERYKQLSPQDKVYLINSLRNVIYIFNAEYFEVPRSKILGLDTTKLTAQNKVMDKRLKVLYGPFGKGVLSISDYLSLFPSVEHAYAAFYYVLRRTWEKMRRQDIRNGHSLVMAFLILFRGSYHPKELNL